MATATAMLRVRPRLLPGPALRRARLPLATTVLSALVHGGVMAALLVGASLWQASQPKTYVVNLVPAIAAVGQLQGKPNVPAPPSVPAPPPEPPAPPKSPPAELPAPAKSVPAELPQRRESPRGAPKEMPARSEPVLPQRSLPAPAPTLPRPGERELPSVATPALPKPAAPPVPVASVPARPEPAAAPPPVPLGRPTGSAQGSGPVTLNVSDFPYAHYLRIIQEQIRSNWIPPIASVPGQQAVAVFEIARDGQVLRSGIEKTSGDRDYDLAALRAIADAKFPPLPQGFKEPLLRVHLGFTFVAGRG